MLSFKRTMSIINIFYGLGFLILFIIGELAHIPIIIPFSLTQQYQIIHICEWFGFCLMFLAGIANVNKTNIISIILAFVSSVVFLAIIFMTSISFSYPFSLLLGYIVPALISMLLTISIEPKN